MGKRWIRIEGEIRYVSGRQQADDLAQDTLTGALMVDIPDPGLKARRALFFASGAMRAEVVLTRDG
jgi:hypothetical protein